MYLSWWMIGLLAVVWIFSVISYGRTSFVAGCTGTIDALEDNGYIKVKKSGDIIGLCNQHLDTDNAPE